MARELAFPPHFRPNLDALYDVLTTDLEGPISIDWRATDNARRALAGDFDAIARTLAEAAAGARRPDAPPDHAPDGRRRSPPARAAADRARSDR
ncbi:MAG: barstar family protein [Geminicoccaceae bacterium]|nr:barstar family protein [Geminicoccaceae bacterium]